MSKPVVTTTSGIAVECASVEEAVELARAFMAAPPENRRRTKPGRRRREAPRRLEVLRLIVDAYRERRPQPSLREIGAALGIRSTNGVNCHIRSLEADGLVRRTSRLARSIVPTPAGVLAGAR